MDDNYLIRPLIFLVQLGFGLYALVAMLRFLLQAVRADFRNPVSQFVVRATSPVLTPLRRIIPPVAGYDTASLVLAWLVTAVELMIVGMLIGYSGSVLNAFLWAIPVLVSLIIKIFLYAVLLVVILSWVGPRTYNPAVSILHRLTEPVMTPARKIVPPIGGLDLSPMLVMAGLYVLEMLVTPPLVELTGTPGWALFF